VPLPARYRRGAAWMAAEMPMTFPMLPMTALVAALFAASMPAHAASSDESLAAAAAAFKPAVAEGIAQTLVSVRTLRERIAAQDLAGAQKAWIAARGGWEQAEIVTDEFFPDLDDAIDSWPNGKHGFHAVEARLFGAHKTDALAQADGLVADLTTFEAKLQTTDIAPQGLFNGMTKLAYEIGENKADGGESQFAGTSIADMAANLEGIRNAYRAVFASRLMASAPQLDGTARKDIDRLAALLKVPDLKSLDADALLEASEDLAATFQAAAPALGLEKPNLGN
jgi:iron uptake system EfeUOB component EfeO/EfeM